MNTLKTETPAPTTPPDIIQTERLTLRPLALDDAGWVSRESGRYEVASKLAFVPSPNPALAAEMFILTARANEANRGDLFRAVIDKATGEGAGLVSATVRGDGRRELGYWYAPSFWGKGYATEAGRALLNVAIAMGAQSFHAGYFAHNPASARVLEKLGFSHDGDETPQFCTAAMKSLPHKGMGLEITP
ncbi:GNAT family N-acetyltransferase [Maricaulaceae bacterium MS644]